LAYLFQKFTIIYRIKMSRYIRVYIKNKISVQGHFVEASINGQRDIWNRDEMLSTICIFHIF